MSLDYYLQFPIKCTPEDPIPNDIWPDLTGALTAKINTWEATPKNWTKFWKEVLNYSIMAFDLETEGLKCFHGNRLVGVAASFFDGKEIQAIYGNFRHQGHEPHSWCNSHETPKPKTCSLCEKTSKNGPCPGYKEEQPRLELSQLQSVISAFKKIIISGQNIKFDIRFMSTEGIEPPIKVLDTMLIAHLYNENLRSYSLETLGAEIGEKKLGDSVKEYATEHCISMEESGHARIPYSVEAPYAIMDTVLVLKRLQWERERWLKLNDHRIMEVFQIENASSPVFAKIETNGAKLDREYLTYGIKRLEAELTEIEAKAHKAAGRKFDIRSLDDLWLVLESRGLKPLKFTAKGGKPSLTDFDLSQYKDEVCDLVKKYRSRHKMLGTYFTPFRDIHIDHQDILHSDYVIQGTVSGRVSCREPNLQNVTKFEKFGSRAATGAIAQAIRGEIKQAEQDYSDLEVRRCFIPREKDYSLFFFDFGQMEIRVFADYANDPFMMNALDKGLDVHAETAKKIFRDFPDKEADHKLYEYYRQLAKQISFGLLYGMGVNKLAIQLDIPVDECVRAIMMIQAAASEGFDIKKATNYTLEQLPRLLEDHALMTKTRQWQDLFQFSKEVLMHIRLEPLEEFLFSSPELKTKHQKLISSAKVFLNNYHAQFPTVRQFTKGIDKAINTRGYIFNRYGRRYHLTPEESYVGINRLVQGSAADVVKLVQWRIDKLLEGKKSLAINQIHDEIVLDLHHSELNLIPEIVKAMTYLPDFKVKLVVDVSYSHTSWTDKHKWVDEKEFTTSLKESKSSSIEKLPKKPAKKLASKT